MALAPFFDKAALAAAAVLQGFDRAQFTAVLEAHVPGLAFDEAAVARFEGRTTLTLLANLIARLYPRVALLPQGPAAVAFAGALDGVLRAVNPSIDVEAFGMASPALTPPPAVDGMTPAPPRPTLLLVVGDTSAATFGASDAMAIYVGSAGWEARVSTAGPVGVGTSALPFGAAAAACLGAANAFRRVFAAQLPGAAPDTALTLSTLSLTVRAATGRAGVPDLDPGALTDLPPILLGDVVQVGAGAVGEGALWTLARVGAVEGTLHVVDDQAVDASNPQRYVLTEGDEVGLSKVALAAELFGGPAAAPDGPSVLRQVPLAERSRLVVAPHPVRWGQFLARRPIPWRLERVLVALDSARDRIAVQAALPAWIANAWTQPGDLGLSRHAGLGQTACLGCLYIPQHAAKSEDVLVAEAIGLPDQLMAVRVSLAAQAPVDEALLRLIAERLRVPANELLPFIGRPLRAFYSEAVCGGLVLRLQAQTGGAPAESAGAAAGDAVGQPLDRAAMVPMVFQSVLAGVFLAAALVAEGAGLLAPAPGQKAILDVLRPVPPRLLFPVAPHPSGKCLCQDPDYQRAYASRWGAEQGQVAHRVTGHAPASAGAEGPVGDASSGLRPAGELAEAAV